jgi:hypothetical protein
MGSDGCWASVGTVKDKMKKVVIRHLKNRIVISFSLIGCFKPGALNPVTPKTIETLTCQSPPLRPGSHPAGMKIGKITFDYLRR